MSVARKTLKRVSFEVFRSMDKLGIHVLPKHYYTPVQDQTWLSGNLKLWARPADLSAVDWDLAAQLEWVRDVCVPYYSEVQGFAVFKQGTEAGYGLGYGLVESQVLHCALRHYKPPKIIEVGSGVSTYCTAKALEMNERDGCPPSQMTCIEPWPAPLLLSMQRVTVIPKLLQELDLSLFRQLESGDLLFIDSSHALKTGSDVALLYLEIIPLLKPGVLIHIHDIFLPYTYSRDSLENYFGWQETALLLALLKGNSGLRVLSCLSALHYDRREELRAALPDYSPQEEFGPGLAHASSPGHFPSSIWLTRI